MPKFSRRADELPSSPIRKLAPYANAAREKGLHVYHLNIGQPDIQTPPEFMNAIHAANLDVVAYSPSSGEPLLRAHISEYYSGLGHELAPENILVTTGASEALDFVLSCVTCVGDEIIIPEPFYANYLSYAISNDANVVPVASSIENDFALPPVEAFAEKITDRTRAILICNPGNPTGVLYPREAMEELREICLRHDLFLISDEVYREFAYDGLQHHSALGLEEMEDHAIVIDSISKRFSACGARIGCLVSRNLKLHDMALKFAQARLSPPTLGQIGAAALYRLPSEYYESVRNEYAARRDLLVSRLGQIDGVVCPKVTGAFYAMVRLPVDNSETFCRWMLEDFEHNGATVMMAPGAGFYDTPGRGVDQVRIAYVLKSEELDSAIDCLESALDQYPGSRR